MSELITAPNLPDPDGAYDLLIRAHDGRTKAESDAFNARLILTLVNHVGDTEILRQAIAVADLGGDEA